MSTPAKTVIREEGFSDYFYKRYMKNQLDGKASNNPHFYITYGPPASGKATIMDIVLKKHGKTKNSVVEINVDDIVKKYEPYIKQRDELEDRYSNNKEKLKGEFQALYMSCRKVLADEASDTLLDKALLRRHDIVWETNGKNIAWTVKEAVRIRKLGYEIVLVYPYVKRASLIERANNRKTQESAPEKDIIDAADKAQLHLPKLINYVDCVYIYDNNGAQNKQRLLLEISHEYLGTTYTGTQPTKKSKHNRADADSQYTGHVYVVDCHVDCKRGESAIIARDDGQETQLVAMIQDFCCSQ
jgi:predicted ABC-type ATPase